MSGNTNDETTIPVIPVENGYLLHSEDHPFCGIDPSCPCHEDPDRIAEVNLCVQEGLLTADEATNTVLGRTI